MQPEQRACRSNGLRCLETVLKRPSLTAANILRASLRDWTFKLVQVGCCMDKLDEDPEEPVLFQQLFFRVRDSWPGD